MSDHIPHSYDTRPFNSSFEYGLRMLFLLEAAKGAGADLQRLVSYDYLLLHSADVQGGPASLHPAVPFRGAEVLVKRDLVRAGLNYMYARELIQKEFSGAGISYRSNALTAAFIGLLKTGYSKALLDRAEWVVRQFGTMHDADLAEYMEEHIGKWGAEFEHFTAASDLEL